MLRAIRSTSSDALQGEPVETPRALPQIGPGKFLAGKPYQSILSAELLPALRIWSATLKIFCADFSGMLSPCNHP